MKALLLAGGLGTRLRPLTEQLPKPMAPVGNRPWLEHLILQLKEQGIEEFVITLKHYPELIRSHFGDGSRLGVSIAYTVEEEALGTAGAIKNAEHLLGERFLVFNADVIQKVDILPLIEFHKQHGGVATIGLTQVEDPSQFGVVDITPSGRILKFIEKPQPGQAPSDLINAGVYLLDRQALSLIPAGKEVSIERETFPLLIQQGLGVYGCHMRGYWLDMGTRERYRKVHWDILDRTFPLPIPGSEQRKGIWVGEDCVIGSGVLLIPPVLIGNRVHIGDKAIIGPNTVIGNDCRIEREARLSETILWDKCRVSRGAHLYQCVFGYEAEAGTGHVLYEAVVNRMKEAMTV
ncbi:sugar phosphate nucleotidyltransferase [Paenibacillus tarimensis]|uniref:sugar phosphate nucleotidyltransferase n=1 Tax=Paenibacillus tarimensis TaxID=416012 RepID=UPI001F1C5484|nr:NDP-sugar synthase [Paenibacillus tarimensis]MCF2944587.1 NDP-sugar synthase [Paenibacillus tarimensis]